MPKALQHAMPYGIDDLDNDLFASYAHMRIVRNRKRAKLLRDRGVELTPYDFSGRAWVWFETDESYGARLYARRAKRPALADEPKDLSIYWDYLRSIRDYRLDIVRGVKPWDKLGGTYDIDVELE